MKLHMREVQSICNYFITSCTLGTNSTIRYGTYNYRYDAVQYITVRLWLIETSKKSKQSVIM